MDVQARSVESCECRRCCTFCDKVVAPRGCLDSRCPYLYAYDDDATGRRYMGCLGKVFGVEIDVGLFEEAERTRHGFGGVKVTGAALAHCPVTVERAYDGSGEAFTCVNPGFLSVAAGPGSRDRAFDLRDRL